MERKPPETMTQLMPTEFFNQDYFEGKSRQSPPHSRDLIYPLAERTATFLLRRFRPGKVLDVGCAKGYLAEAFQARGVRAAFGIDVSVYAVTQGGAPMRGKLIVGDAGRGLPLAAGSCDLITAVDLFEHLPEPAQVLGEIRRVLGRDGVAYLKICHPRHPNAHRDPSHVNVQELGYWTTLFDGSGFRWKRIYESDLTEYRGGVGLLKAAYWRAREWAELGTHPDYKFIIWKASNGKR